MNTPLSNKSCEFVTPHLFHLFGFINSNEKSLRVSIQNLHPTLTLRILSISLEQSKGLELTSLKKGVEVPKIDYPWSTLQGPVLNIKPQEVAYTNFSVLCSETPLHVVGWWMLPDPQNRFPEVVLQKTTPEFIQVSLTDQENEEK